MGKNFIVQDRIKQHSLLDRLNPTSVNTIRVNSLLTSDGVYIPCRRIPFIHPEKGEIPDNYKWSENPLGVKGKTRFVVPCMEKIRESVKRIHPLIPHFRWVGWDFTVDSENDPVLIEINPMPGHATSQLTTCKPMFGEMTKDILDDYYIHRTLKDNQRQERLFE